MYGYIIIVCVHACPRPIVSSPVITTKTRTAVLVRVCWPLQLGALASRGAVASALDRAGIYEI